MESEGTLKEEKKHLKPSRNEDNMSRNEVQQRKLKKALKKKLERGELFNSSILVLSTSCSVSLAIH